MKKSFQEMLEEHRLKQKLASNPIENIPESDLELDHQSAYKPNNKPSDPNCDIEEARLEIKSFSSLDQDKKHQVVEKRPLEFFSQDNISLPKKLEKSPPRLQKDPQKQPKSLNLLNVLKEFKVPKIVQDTKEIKQIPSDLFLLLGTSIGKTVPERQSIDLKSSDQGNQYSRSFVTHSEVDVSQHRRLKSEIHHSGLKHDHAEAIHNSETGGAKKSQVNHKAQSRLHAILKDLGGSYQQANQYRTQIRGHQTERLADGRSRELGLQSKLISSRDVTDLRMLRKKGSKQAASKNQNLSLAENLLPSYSGLRQSFKKNSNFEEIFSRAKLQLSMYKNRRVSNAKGSDKLPVQKNQKSVSGITDNRRDTPYPERLSSREEKVKGSSISKVNATLKKVTNQGMESMFRRRLNVKLPDTRNSSIESERSHQNEADSSKYIQENSNLVLRHSANITSPRMRITSLNLRTSEALFPRNPIKDEKKEDLIESIKNKYLQRLESASSQGLQTARLPFTSPKTSLKTSALSERALSPEPVNTPKLLNLIKDFKKSQTKPSK